MRVFWHNGALQLLPETQREGQLLAELSENVKFEKPPEMQNRTPDGESESGSETLFEAIITNHQARPRSLAGQRNHKQHIVGINKPL